MIRCRVEGETFASPLHDQLAHSREYCASQQEGYQQGADATGRVPVNASTIEVTTTGCAAAAAVATNPTTNARINRPR